MAQLPSDLKAFVDQELAARRFHSQDEMEVAGLQLLKRDRDEAVASIREGLESMTRGEGTLLGDVMARIRKDYGISTGV